MGKKSRAARPVLAVAPPPGTPLYPHPDTGQPLLTNSMVGAFRRCIKQAEYKYVHRLKPIKLGSPLKRGTWVHELLEVDAKGGDWKKHHKKLSAQFDTMFDEEKEFYGDMPTEIGHLVRSYFWHYKHDPWIWHEAELELTAELPNGVLMRIKVDGLIENQWGLWLVDHKTNKTLPKLTYRMLDTQSPLYTWVAHQNDIPVNGFIWNYIRWKAPTYPKLAYAGTARERLSKSAIDTDYPTFKRGLKMLGQDPEEHAERLRYLKSQRYAVDEPQTSTFFRRDVMEKQPDLLDRVIKEAVRTSDRMNNYDWQDRDSVERTVGRHCEFMCSYSDLCTTELLGGNPIPLMKQNYEQGDPMSYYHDRVGEYDRDNNERTE